MARQNAILDAFSSQQREAVRSMQHLLANLEDRLSSRESRTVITLPRVGIFVDVPNVMLEAEKMKVTLDFGKLLEYLTRGRELVRASAYAPISDDPTSRLEVQRFVQPFVGRGYRIITKPLKRFADGTVKANFDIELAMDVLTMSERLDTVVLVSGDGDFRRLVELVASKGVRVEVVAFAQSTSADLRTVADQFTDLGTLLPELQA